MGRGALRVLDSVLCSGACTLCKSRGAGGGQARGPSAHQQDRAGGRTLGFAGRAAHGRVLAEGLRVDRSRRGPRGPRRGGGPELSPCAPSPLYDQYCKDHFRDGHCDQGCNSAECEWDGLDCAEHVPERLAAGTLVLVAQGHAIPDG